jgi:hypothetical protein
MCVALQDTESKPIIIYVMAIPQELQKTLDALTEITSTLQWKKKMVPSARRHTSGKKLAAISLFISAQDEADVSRARRQLSRNHHLDESERTVLLLLREYYQTSQALGVTEIYGPTRDGVIGLGLEKYSTNTEVWEAVNQPVHETVFSVSTDGTYHSNPDSRSSQNRSKER